MRIAGKRTQIAIAIVLCATAVSYAVHRLSRISPESSGRASEVMMVELRGGDVLVPIMPMQALWLARSPTDPALVAPLREDSLTVIIDEEDDTQGILRYSRDMGPTLNLWFDGPILRVDGRAHSLVLDKSDDWNVLAHAPDTLLADVRVLAIDDEPNSEQLPLLRRLATLNPEVLISSVEESIFMPLADILPLFEMLEEIAASEGEDVLDDPAIGLEKWCAARPKMETFQWLYELPGPESLQTISQLAHLRNLTLGEWEPEDTGPMPEGFHQLASLTLGQSSLTNLVPLAACRGLQELVLVECGALESLDGISAFPGLLRLQVLEDGDSALEDITAIRTAAQLRSLDLTGCTNVFDLTPLRELTQLTDIALPPTTTQEQFDALMSALPRLGMVYMSDCGGVTNLNALQDLPRLQVLSAALQHHGDALAILDELPYLILWTDDGEDKDLRTQFAALRARLPGTRIVTAVRPCLGSGYVLWLVPVALLARWMVGRGGA